MERHEYTNPWADKLQEVQLPDANDSWSAMAVLLDKEMPMAKQPNRRRWLLLIILLLLLIGVCNCPRRDRWHLTQTSGRLPVAPPAAGISRTTTGAGSRGTMDTVSRATTDDTIADVKTRPAPHASGPQVSGTPVSGPETSTSLTAAPSASGAADPGASAHPATRVPSAVRAIPAPDHKAHDISASKRTKTAPGALRSKTPGSGKRRSSPPSSGSSRHKDVGGDVRNGVRNGHRAVAGNSDGGSGDEVAGNKPSRGTDTLSGGRTGDRTLGGVDGTKKSFPGNIPDSGAASRATTPGNVGKPPNNGLAKKPTATPDNKKTPAADTTQKETERGLVAGIGFNQFFSVGQQQKSDYNSGGTSGGLGDYLPVPMVRYYFSRKLYVQLEAQFNAPQYTKKNLVAGQSAGDSLSPGVVQQSSVTIKKLFYFNLPLSVHYSPFKNLYLGAGLQYSRLSNGVGLYQDKVLVTGGSDTVKAVKIYSFKGDSIYQKIRTNELRFLLDINYNYKRIIVGVRYNQALSKFLDVHISNTQVTQARNSSLQLYLRYILLDNRKKRKSSSK